MCTRPPSTCVISFHFHESVKIPNRDFDTVADSHGQLLAEVRSLGQPENEEGRLHSLPAGGGIRPLFTLSRLPAPQLLGSKPRGFTLRPGRATLAARELPLSINHVNSGVMIANAIFYFSRRLPLQW
jgi:hypothetical protein